MPRNQDRNPIRIAAIMNSLPGTAPELMARTGIPQSSLSRWCRRLLAEGKIHYLAVKPTAGGGPLIPIYLAGPKPKHARARYQKKRTNAERMTAYRAKARADGRWEDILAKRRLKRAAARRPSIDPLMQAFYGVEG